MEHVPQPRRPGLTAAALRRIGGRVLAAATLVWLLALVAWPERAVLTDIYSAKLRAILRECIRLRRRPYGWGGSDIDPSVDRIERNCQRGVADVARERGVPEARFYRVHHPDLDGEDEIYVREASLKALLGNLAD